jgi:hypothetical protein
VPVGNGPLDLVAVDDLVRLPVAIVVVVLTRANDDERRRAADPRREALAD